MERRLATAWREIPVDELRRFMAELVADTNLREAGRLIGRGREMVRRFISGDIETPHARTRQSMARLYLQKHGVGVLESAEVRHPGPTATPLRLILPVGVERATAELRAIFEGVRRHSDRVPPSTAALERWLIRRVKEEYATETPYARPRQRHPRTGRG